ncbi:MAG: rhodanese-like domain-containing protein [Deltaproteobacteria bacterium]|nr:rhodanese-like domain-containing protein [Deltaproteobacteria bacterium]
MTEQLASLLREAPAGFFQIAPQDAAGQLEAFHVVDVRSAEEFHGPMSHIPGARLMPLDRLSMMAGDLPREKQLLVVCHSGARSTLASEMLIRAGFANVVNLEGGMNRWRSLGLPTVATHPERAQPKTPSISQGGAPEASEEALLALTRTTLGGFREISPADAARHQAAFHILDVRSPEEFHGNLSHIPGARSIPLDTLGTALAGLPRNKMLLTVCRSGMRSALAAQMLVQAGFPRVINLAGGMTAWNTQGLITAADQPAAPSLASVPVPPSAESWATVRAAARPISGYFEISPEAVSTHLDALRVVDVRSAEEFNGNLSHIPSAEQVSLEVLPTVIGSWDPRQPLLLVCRSGRRSAMAAEYLARAGFSRVVNLTGGMMAWNAQGLRTAAENISQPAPRKGRRFPWFS